MGSLIPGTGTPIDLGNKPSGTYTIVGTSNTGGCIGNTSNSITINSGSAPTAFTVSGGGNYCSGPGVAIGLSNSETGVNYVLMLNVTTNVGFATVNKWHNSLSFVKLYRKRNILCGSNQYNNQLYRYDVKQCFHQCRFSTYSVQCNRFRQLLLRRTWC